MLLELSTLLGQLLGLYGVVLGTAIAGAKLIERHLLLLAVDCHLDL